ncbi:MAG: hypothetical protein KDD64_12950 [Bdellovibrionales bacterium]|nr:hypothetical protein [Bdellovibrionales bacterium]
MPYIQSEEREQYHELIVSLAQKIPVDRMARPGHLNYIVTQLLHTVYGKQMRYADHNEAIGVLHCIAEEFYRRKTAPYEDLKINEEGDVEFLRK